MHETNFIFIIVGFFIGYIIKGFFIFRSGYSQSAILVEETSKQALKLIGTTVYRIALVEQLCKNYISALKDKEEAKIHCNEMEDAFEEWKKETMKVFVTNYPQEYKWQLEVNDWDGAMKALTDIYKKRK